jgi:hypothetical protein
MLTPTLTTGTARATIAASVSSPHGTQTDNYANAHRTQTVLQQHVAFFDGDGDGIIWPTDTYRGFRALGFHAVLAALAAVIIHTAFSYPTLPRPVTLPMSVPDPCFRLYTASIHRCKHGSDSGAFDNEGRFIPQRFEDLFSKYAAAKRERASHPAPADDAELDPLDDDEGITLREAFALTHGQRVLFDPFGAAGALFECEWSTQLIPPPLLKSMGKSAQKERGVRGCAD